MSENVIARGWRLCAVWLFGALAASGCEIVSYERDAYPTVYAALPEGRLNALQAEFRALHDNEICTLLNAYGFVDDESCIGRQNPRSVLSEEQALEIAKGELVEFSRFTNIFDASLLIVEQVSVLGLNDSTSWKFRFEPQVYEGYEVKGTKVSVFVYGTGIYQIYGHWYPRIYIPEASVSQTAAEQSLVGRVMTYYDCMGRQQYAVAADDFGDAQAVKVILPHEAGDNIEMRVAWQIPVYRIGPDWPEWYIYVDVVSGEILMEEHQVEYC